MSAVHVTKSLFLPELKFIKQVSAPNKKTKIYELQKVSKYEVCPKCAIKVDSIYDHVYVTIRDIPLRGKQVILKIRKRRFRCTKCKSVFREPVNGIKKGFRTSQRFRRYLMFCSSNFATLKRVAKQNKCSDWLVYKCYYEQVELETRKFKTPWPKTIGIDEHSFIRNQYGRKDFATVFVDYNNKKVREAVYGRYPADLLQSKNLQEIEERENVKNVIIDLSSGFKSFSKEFFSNATITADKFHRKSPNKIA